MASVNIGGGDDEFNRYKMPPVLGKVEGRGNGIKTRIVNCYEVARALHRPPGYVCKFFGCELGAQTRIDDNASVYIVNGAFAQPVLAETLKKFIEMFVLCPNCNLPETDLKLKKNGNITQVCNACGHEGICDMTHKLCTYIANNPPDGKKKKSDGKRDKAARRALKAKKSNGETHDELDEKAKRRAARKAKKAAESNEGLGMGDIDFAADAFESINDFAPDGDDDDVQWSVDTSKEAEEARKRELGAAASILERGAGVNSGDGDMARKLKAYIDGGKKPSKVLSKSTKIFGEDEAIRGIMMAAVVDETPATMPDSVNDRAIPVFKNLGEPMEAHTQLAFLDYFDWVAGHDKKMLQVMPHILKHAYDADIIEEEQIFKWYRIDGGKPEVREAVRQVVEWLETADEESEDEEESESSE
eukprot:GFKZ01011196.1.p1 GENE.GFKZ01011196.1~~GFKZ01011196.1.p1  ORF type:complete len:416 (+),score=106.58 GFKZ01011196.1:468-1715(+)